MLDWLNIGLRWTHLVAGIGWIGTSLYFMWLDAALIRSDAPRGGVEGHAWLLHSGGFYLVERRKLPPGQLPSPIHWFKWEAAMTWLTGFPPLVRGRGLPAAILSWALLFAGVFGLTHVLSGRAAFIHTGAMVGTIMVANV